jgi:GT2 family glycosyltransferase
MIDAVVVTADSRDMVLECLDHLRSPLLHDVVVVDNGSGDDTAAVVARRYPGAKLVRNRGVSPSR